MRHLLQSCKLPVNLLAQLFALPLQAVSVAIPAAPECRVAAAVAGAIDVARNAGAQVDGRVVAGRAAESIAAVAGEYSAAPIVVGLGGPSSHGHRFLLGGNAHRIVALAACPVLVVKT